MAKSLVPGTWWLQASTHTTVIATSELDADGYQMLVDIFNGCLFPCTDELLKTLTPSSPFETCF